MQNAIILQNVSPEEFTGIIDQSVKRQLDDLKKLLNIKEPDELLTRSETCKFLKIDSSTLWSWTNKGKVKAHGIGHRRYYKKSELLESLTLLKK